MFTTIHFNILFGFLQIWPFCVKSTATISAIPGILLQTIVLLLLLSSVCYIIHMCVGVCVHMWLQAKE